MKTKRSEAARRQTQERRFSAVDLYDGISYAALPVIAVSLISIAYNLIILLT